MTVTLSFAHPVGEGVYAIDTGFGRACFDASYLIVQGSELAFVDVGTNDSIPRLLKTIDELGFSPDHVKYVILTHVHLDHAGGAGEIMRHCAQSKLLVHPRGARHMIDPSALRAGAVAVYGEEAVAAEYGTLWPIEATRVIEIKDDDVFTLANRHLHIMDTPGHAKHHVAIWDPATRGVFTGDTFGLSYREFDTERGAYVFPTTTPIQFDPEALKDSVERIAALNPDCIYPTHYSRANDVPHLKRLFLKQLDEMVAIAMQLKHASNRHEKLKIALLNIYENHLKAHGCQLNRAQIEEFLKIDVELNAQGIGVWLDKL